MTERKIIVIGGGPAGLMAAGRAAEAGAETLLLEKMRRPGLKLSITGKGRCNITNIAEVPELIAHFGPTGRFLRQAFHRFSNTDLMAFLQALGLDLVTERGGRVFPASGKAADVLAALLRWATHCGASIQPACAVERLLYREGRMIGVGCRGRTYTCDRVILATGGASYPRTGSTGDGYRLAESAGHTIVPVRPALVPLETAEDAAGQMAGLTLRNVGVRMLAGGKKRKAAFGELTFTEFGVSGPVVLTLSGAAVDALREGHPVVLSIDLKPALDDRKLEARLLRDIAGRRREPAGSLLRGLLPREMVPVCLALTGIPADQRAGDISAKARRRLRVWLKDFRLTVTAHRPLEEAIVTAGGIDTREIDPRTLASRRIRGLYLAGEVLDLQADTGGYNLQAAFSTGWLAGGAAGRAG